MPYKLNLFLIGTMKSGATTLHGLFGRHTEGSMSKRNGPCYFIGHVHLKIFWSEMWRMGLWKNEPSYLALLKGRPQVTRFGESRVGVMTKKNAAFNPLTHFICLIRRPIAHFLPPGLAQTFALYTKLGEAFDNWEWLWGTAS